MTGSLEGLTALISTDGYKHHSKLDLQSSAQAGCPCCELLWAKASELWRGSFVWESRVVAVDTQGQLISGQTFGEEEESLNAFKVHGLASLRYMMIVDRATATFSLFIFTNQGKCNVSPISVL
jgi:hypothetical protein